MPPVESGLEVLVRRRPALLRGQRVALLTHQASIDSRYEHAVTLVRDLRGVKVRRLLAPEHGLWGAPQDHIWIDGARDPATGLPVWSLYGARREPTAPMLRGIDTVVVDLQDVGSRYYTFIWTMALAMRACARSGVRVVVLDRPNPLGGAIVEGNVADPAFASFVGLYPLAIRHGLTIGEIAQYLNERHRIGCQLTVVPMRGWRRRMLWEDTGLPWVPPSPNMPTLDTARVYPGGCLIEGTNLSEGRGTTRPFEWIGAPYLDAHRDAAALEALRLPGVHFRPARFQPTFHKWAGRLCDGVQIHVTDVHRFKPFLTGLAEITIARRLAPRGFAWRRPPYEFEKRRMPIDILCGTDEIRRAIEKGTPLPAIERAWQGDLVRWKRLRAAYLMY
ncbi:MAG: exo-beta-N-acetylmuramidase NamZ family protein [Candidatus Rokuibacteriota bacterium]